MRIAVVAFFALGAGIWPTISFGAPITFGITGTVDFLSDDTNLLGGKVSLNDVFTATYTFDSATPNTSPDPLLQGQYKHVGNPFGTTGNVGLLSFSITPTTDNPFRIFVNNDVGLEDDYFFRGDFEQPNAFGLGVDRVIFDMDLFSSNLTTFTSTNLLLNTPELDLFDLRRRIRFAGGGASFFDVRATIIKITAIPTPGSLPLFLSGLVIISFLAWCRKGVK